MVMQVTDDEKQIRDVLNAYALRLDVDDIEGCLELFSDDGEFIVYGKTLVGRDRIREMFTRAPRGIHLTGAALINVDTEKATARTQVLFAEVSKHELRPAIYDYEFI